MIKFKKIFLTIIFAFFLSNYAYSLENKILFKVNNDIVTSLDILNELRYLQIINKEFKNADKKQAFEIAKKSLIREKIKENELKKNFKDIKLDEQFLNKTIIKYFNNIQIDSISSFENYFNSVDIDPDSIKKKITIEIMWNQLIYKRYAQNIKINREIIANNLNKRNKQKEFLLSEILFNVNEGEDLDKKFKSIKNKIETTTFSEAALIYSISDTANKNGELGWIKESSMSNKIKEAIQKISINNYSDPIIIPGGILILKIRDIRETANYSNLEDEIDKIVVEKTNEQLNQLSNIFFNKIKQNIKINEL